MPGKQKPQRQKTKTRKTAKPARPVAQKKTRAATSKNQDQALREHLLYLLGGGGAHVSFEKTIAGFPPAFRGVKPSGLPFTAWRILEHMRIALWDILEFSRAPEHVSPEWPKGYWPAGDAPPDEAAWEKSVKAIQADLRAMERLVKNSSTDLYARIPHGTSQTILREALLVADHNSYHLGQLVMLRRLLGAWHGE